MVVGGDGVERDSCELEIGLDARISMTILRIRGRGVEALTCHFKHEGLNDKSPRWAPSSVVQIQRACSSRWVGEVAGSSLAAYVSSGNFRKTRFTGSGTPSLLRQFVGCCFCGCEGVWAAGAAAAGPLGFAS